MARIRTVKPEFWTDDALTECSRDARLLFIGTWNFADDKGGLDRSAKQLKGQVFPHDELDVEALIQELQRSGSLIEYEVNGQKYLHIKNFEKHQVINRPSPSRVPPYDSSLRTQRILPDHSVSHHIPLTAGLEGKGREGNGKGRESPSSPPKGTEQVFAHWQGIYRHPQAVLDNNRKRVIERALKHYSPEVLCEAISGYCNSPHHMGQNKDGTVFDDVSLLLRNATHIEAGLRFARSPPAAQNETQRRQAANLQTATEWVAQGKDHADH